MREGMRGVDGRVGVRVGARKRYFWGWWILATIMLISTFVVSLSVVFSDTIIRIEPVVTKALFKNKEFNAVKAGTDVADDAILEYSVIEWDISKTELVEPTGVKTVKEKASGIITVYNDYTSRPQRLIKNTRFETEDGYVYRVRESIVVPGRKNGKPGELDVRVYADEPGSEYNRDTGNLTLPGLKSLPDMYATIYAKIKTPITGGFLGERAVISENVKKEISEKLRADIRQTVEGEILGRVPEDAYYFDSGVFVDFDDTDIKEDGDKIAVTENAVARVFVFDKKNFAKVLSAGVLGNPDKGYPLISDISDLDVKITTSSRIDDLELDNEIVKVLINGPAEFVWYFDYDKLISDLAGKNRNILNNVLSGYPTIKSADAIIRPFWRKTFPKDADDFTIEILDGYKNR